MSVQKIQQAQSELKRISALRTELDDYEDCVLKRTLLKLCDFCELIMQKELLQLQNSKTLQLLQLNAGSVFRTQTIAELEHMAFDISISDDTAKKALAELLVRF